MMKNGRKSSSLWVDNFEKLGDYCMYKKFFSAALCAGLLAGSLSAAENALIGVVNFTTCITDSRHGKKEQENMEALRKQMSSLIENTEKELREISAKFEDTEYLDGLSPKAEEELKAKFQALQEDLGRYQNQFYQVLQHANYQMIQKMSGSIASAAEKVATSNKLDYVMNKEACFYIRPDLDVTTLVISEMDKKYEIDAKSKKVSENEELAIDEMTVDKAG
jgi:outer membrane protein